MSKKLSQEDFLSRVGTIHGDSLTLEKTVYINKRQKVTVTCPRHGDFDILPDNLTRKTSKGCPMCRVITTKEDFVERCREVHGDTYHYDRLVYTGYNARVEIGCPKHGYYWCQARNHLSGSGCLLCHNEGKRLGKKAFINKARKIHGSAYSYKNVSYVNSNTEVEIVCKNHGAFMQKPKVHLLGSGCQVCAAENSTVGIENFIRRANIVHSDRYLYGKVLYVNNKTPVTVTCKDHGDFDIRPDAHLHMMTGCPRCRCTKGEKVVQKTLSALGLEFLKEQRLPNSLLRYDFYIPKYGLYIEFNGIQHYEPVDRFGGLKGHLATVIRDSEKAKIIMDLSEHLLIIPYWAIDDVHDLISKCIDGMST